MEGGIDYDDTEFKKLHKLFFALCVTSRYNNLNEHDSSHFVFKRFLKCLSVRSVNETFKSFIMFISE